MNFIEYWFVGLVLLRESGSEYKDVCIHMALIFVAIKQPCFESNADLFATLVLEHGGYQHFAACMHAEHAINSNIANEPAVSLR